ncbi:MAG: hypothetical protein H6505_02865 [Calditrichaeota bacterium]|nr:hypothetical protein [Calditrichota bacterium]
MSRENIALALVFFAGLVIWAAIRTKIFFGWDRGADFGAEMVRQYGAPKAWLILFLATLALGVIFLVMTTAW